MISRKPLLSVLGLALAVAASMLGSNQSLAQKKKQQPAAHAGGPPSLSLSADPLVLRNCAEDSKVRLVAAASSADGSPLRYKWTSNGGQLIGDGANTSWDLSGAKPGVYQAVVEVDDGRDLNCVAFSTATVVVTECPPEKPVLTCPNVSVSCPDVVADDKSVTFTAAISGGSANVVPTYTWTISAGKIISGQGTPSVTVDATGLAGQTIRANLEVGGFNTPCPASCATSLPIPIKAHKFDEYPDISFNDEKARLDNFAIQLQSEPSAKGYIIVHPPLKARSGVAEKRMHRTADYLVHTRGLDASRIVTKIDGAGDGWLFELWIVPEGAPPPIP